MARPQLAHVPAWAGWMGQPRGPQGATPRPHAPPAEAPEVVARREFRQMLVELDVNEFSRYDKLGPKMEKDTRCYSARALSCWPGQQFARSRARKPVRLHKRCVECIAAGFKVQFASAASAARQRLTPRIATAGSRRYQERSARPSSTNSAPTLWRSAKKWPQRQQSAPHKICAPSLWSCLASRLYSSGSSNRAEHWMKWRQRLRQKRRCAPWRLMMTRCATLAWQQAPMQMRKMAQMLPVQMQPW